MGQLLKRRWEFSAIFSVSLRGTARSDILDFKCHSFLV